VDDTNHVLYTALPGAGVCFTGLTHARAGDRADARPRVAFGMRYVADGRLMILAGLEVNHAFIDQLTPRFTGFCLQVRHARLVCTRTC
jgi:chloramphenicol O-acetyltransferase